MIESKVILFIVEGPLDRFFYQEYLEHFISQFSSNHKLQYKITNCDVLAVKNPKGIVASVESEIKGALDENKFNVSDLMFVAHICDIDGSYLMESDFLIDQEDSIPYKQKYKYALSNKKIYSESLDHRDQLMSSWRIKKNNQKDLYRIGNVLGVKYRLYYNSIYLEHLLTGGMPFDSENKRDCLDDFLNKYEFSDNFISFIDNFCLSSDYTESWLQLENHNNKLIRASNLNIMFRDIEGLINNS